ncbi:ankyrin repeat-containing domain protein [Annulohypoxylon maeteangense]|uniref:ankyrin repeat-containing domain protein n=1 Tax=Annulohypoxylon maeteangense TaxID=1927788 RepID=UPI00200823D1|nr:ankyrin repeat-containing domain protein [Annulohypoxylon maeteangense]KAI0889608.1 ankyrin repeat-containing domain protein [Annulohypoxylon maeteangense]
MTIAEFTSYQSTRTEYHQHLAALALTNRRLHQVCNPILYRTERDLDQPSVVVWAAANDRIETLEKAVFFRLDLNARKPGLYSSLYIAVKYRNELIVAWLLDHGAAVDIEPVIESPCAVDSNFSPLFLALNQGQSSVANLLIERGACLTFSVPEFRTNNTSYEWGDVRYSPSDRYRELNSAISTASSFGLISVIRYLIQYKAMDINTPESNGRICLHHAIMAKQDWAMIKELIQLGADINWNTADGLCSPLSCAIQMGNFTIAHGLIDAGSRINTSFVPRLGLLHICTWDTCRFFDQELAQQQESDKDTLLKKLIDLGADVNGLDVENQANTPLKEAFVNGTLDAMLILIQAGAEVDMEIVLEWIDGDRVWVTDEYVKKAIMLMDHCPRLDLRCQQNITILENTLTRCIAVNQFIILDIMLGYATKQNLSTEYLDNLLEAAIESRFFKCCMLLLEHGARGKNGDSMVSWLEYEIDLRREIKDYDSSSDDSDFQSLMVMFMDLNLGFEIESRVLMKALEYRDRDAVYVPLSRGMTGRCQGRCDPNKWLQEAASWGHVGVMRRLLRGSPDVNGFDDENELPLSRAIRGGHRESALLLMGYGADAYLCKTIHIGEKTDQTLKPIQHAVRYGDVRMLNAIIDEQAGSLSEEEAWVPAVLASAPEIAQVVSARLL